MKAVRKESTVFRVPLTREELDVLHRLLRDIVYSRDLFERRHLLDTKEERDLEGVHVKVSRAVKRSGGTVDEGGASLGLKRLKHFTQFEKALSRPANFLSLAPEDQWAIDKARGILDWAGECAHGQMPFCAECQKKWDRRQWKEAHPTECPCVWCWKERP